jgi:hypothetical protein
VHLSLPIAGVQGAEVPATGLRRGRLGWLLTPLRFSLRLLRLLGMLRLLGLRLSTFFRLLFLFLPFLAFLS